MGFPGYMWGGGGKPDSATTQSDRCYRTVADSLPYPPNSLHTLLGARTVGGVATRVLGIVFPRIVHAPNCQQFSLAVGDLNNSMREKTTPIASVKRSLNRQCGELVDGRSFIQMPVTEHACASRCVRQALPSRPRLLAVRGPSSSFGCLKTNQNMTQGCSCPRILNRRFRETVGLW